MHPRLQDQGSSNPNNNGAGAGHIGTAGTDTPNRAPLSPKGSDPTSPPPGCGTNPIYGQSLSRLGSAPGQHDHSLSTPKPPTMGDQSPNGGTDHSHRGATELSPTRAAGHGEPELLGDKSKEKENTQRAGTGCGGGSRLAQDPLPGIPPKSSPRPGDGAPEPCLSLGGLGPGDTGPCAVGTSRGPHSRSPAASALPSPGALAQREQIKAK